MCARCSPWPLTPSASRGLETFDAPLGQIRRAKHKRQRGFPRLRVRVEHEEINVVFVIAPRLADVFAVLADEEFVQLEVFPDDGFADSRHINGSGLRVDPSSVAELRRVEG